MCKLQRVFELQEDHSLQYYEKDGRLYIALEGRIDSNNAAGFDKEIAAALTENAGAEPVFDVGGLEYISSAGLRVFMKVRKTAGKSITIENASPEVYDIFEVTGFTSLFNVKKKLREISVDGCEKIGEGGNGAVYRLDDDKIVKVYKPWMDFDDIDRERSFAKTAFVNGIPSVIAYDTVRVGDSLGIVFEMLKSDTLGHAIIAHPERFDEYMDKYVALAKTLHSTHVPEGSFTPVHEVLHKCIDNMTQWCSKEEIALLHRIADSIPKADTITHNDLHPGNIMLQGDELVLIDMPEVTMGPPVCDMTSIYRDLIAAPSGEQKGSIEKSTGMPAEMCLRVGNEFFRRYYGLTDKQEVEGLYQKLGLLFAFNTVLTCGAGSEIAAKLAPYLMEKLLRPIVVPNEQTICYLFANFGK